jgi:hypothetical protein
MAVARIGKLNLAGFQSIERTIEALPVRVDYQSPRYEHFLQRSGNDWRLGFSLIGGQPDQGEIRETTHLDPYAIRGAFDAVDSAEAAIQFLSEAGVFWPWGAVLWSQFQEWQTFFRYLRVDRDTAMKTPEGKRAWLTVDGFKRNKAGKVVLLEPNEEFFTTTDSDFTRARFQGADIPPEDLQRNKREDHVELFKLRHFVQSPGTPGFDGRIALGWYDPKDGHAPEDGKARGSRASKDKGASYEPFLRIEAQNILEAVAATIYVDKAQRLRHGQCKHCGKVFEIRSGHGQEFCPPPIRPRGLEIKTSPCKNAYLQQQRRGNEKRAIALLLERNNLSESEIESEARAKGIRLTPKAKASAEKRRLA